MVGRIQDVDLRLLRLFQTVVQRGGLAAAQEDLNLSLSTISTHVKQLEGRLSLRLCDRGPSGFRLTPQGDAVARATITLLGAVESFQKAIDKISGSLRGEVRLGLLDNLSANPSSRVHQAIHNMAAKHPQTAVTFHIAEPRDLHARVRSGELDLAIGIFPDAAGTVREPLFEEVHDLYCARDNPLYGKTDVTTEQLRNCEYVGWSHLEPLVADSNGLNLAPVIGSSFLEGVACLVLGNDRIGYLPRHFAAPRVSSGDLWPLVPQQASRSVAIVLLRREVTDVGPAALHLMDELRQTHAPCQR